MLMNIWKRNSIDFSTLRTILDYQIQNKGNLLYAIEILFNWLNEGAIENEEDRQRFYSSEELYFVRNYVQNL